MNRKRKKTLTELVLAELSSYQTRTANEICSSLNKAADTNSLPAIKVKSVSATLTKIYKSPLGPFMSKTPPSGKRRGFAYLLAPETQPLTLDEIHQLTLSTGHFSLDQALQKAPALKRFIKQPPTPFVPLTEEEKKRQQERLLEIHVRHELSLYRGNALKATIRNEIRALYEWLQTVVLNDILPPKQVINLIQRNIIDAPIPREFTNFLMECAKHIHDFLKRNETQMGQLVPKEQYNKALKNLIGLKKLRREITTRSVSGSVYAELISDILYRTTKDFILTENIIIRSIPGVSSLIKFGQETLHKTIPKVEEVIDRRLIDFIKNNIQNIMQQSEKLLNRKMNEAFLMELGQQVWNVTATKRISHVTDFIMAEQIEAFAEVAEESWSHFRKSPLFHDIIQKLVQAFYEQYGNRNLNELLVGLAFTPESVEKESLEIVPRIMDQALATGYLEKRVRRRLATFYLPGEADDHDQ